MARNGPLSSHEARAIAVTALSGSENTKMPEKKPNGLQQVLKPSHELSAVVGAASLSRGEVVSKMWAYIKANKLQNPANKREILADSKLRPVFGGKDRVNMFEMNKHIAKHLK
jgi:upstream activation factor subunit UAF30